MGDLGPHPDAYGFNDNYGELECDHCRRFVQECPEAVREEERERFKRIILEHQAHISPLENQADGTAWASGALDDVLDKIDG